MYSSIAVEQLLRQATETLPPKRRHSGLGLDGWYPYYAGFSYLFAREALAAVCRPNARLVLDPWNGSGTTMAAALRLGFRPIGYDLNPCTVVVANAKLATKAELLSARRLFAECDASVASAGGTHVPASEPLLAWLPPALARFARSAISWLVSRERVRTPSSLSPASAVVAVALLYVLRDSAVDSGRSNSSWQHPRNGKVPTRIRDVRSRIVERLETMILDLEECPNERAPGILASVGDARRLPIPDGSVDVVLSSPPYCTRIDYAKQTSFELAALSAVGPEQSRSLRDSLMGTTTLRSVKPPNTEAFPSCVGELLKAIERHPSHRSAAYYARNFRQYYDDAMAGISEIARVLRPDGRAVLVLQNSYYKELEIELSRHYCNIAALYGLRASVVAKKQVGRAMTSINTRSRAYAANRHYSEDVVLLEK